MIEEKLMHVPLKVWWCLRDKKMNFITVHHTCYIATLVLDKSAIKMLTDRKYESADQPNQSTCLTGMNLCLIKMIRPARFRSGANVSIRCDYWTELIPE